MEQHQSPPGFDLDTVVKFVVAVATGVGGKLGWDRYKAKDSAPAFSADHNYAEELARLIRESNTAIDRLCDEVRRWHDDQLAEHRDNQEALGRLFDSQQEIRNAINNFRR